MAYGSASGRRPMERASKISHSEIINSAPVKELLATCSVPKAADGAVIDGATQEVSAPDTERIRAVVAIDGGYREVSVRDEFPSATLTFFTFGPLLFQLKDLRDLDAKPFLAPEDMARLKKIQRYTLALPTRNISREGKSLQVSIRETLQDFFEHQDGEEAPLADALRWILFRPGTRAPSRFGRSRNAPTTAALQARSFWTPTLRTDSSARTVEDHCS